MIKELKGGKSIFDEWNAIRDCEQCINGIRRFYFKKSLVAAKCSCEKGIKLPKCNNIISARDVEEMIAMGEASWFDMEKFQKECDEYKKRKYPDKVRDDYVPF